MPRYSNDDQRGNMSRDRDDEGRFTRGGRENDYDARSRGARDEDADFNDWHAYGHARGWHAHQQGRHGMANMDRERDDRGRFTGGRDRDDDRAYGASSSQGRGWHGDPEGHARAGSMSHSGAQSHGRYEDDDDDRMSRGQSSGERASEGRERDENGRFTSHRH